jgi:DNA-binding MarR family transcriptional regulator
MTYLLDDLEAAKLVERQPDPADRRSRRVVATAHGREVLADLDARFARAEQHLLPASAPTIRRPSGDCWAPSPPASTTSTRS